MEENTIEVALIQESLTLAIRVQEGHERPLAYLLQRTFGPGSVLQVGSGHRQNEILLVIPKASANQLRWELVNFAKTQGLKLSLGEL